MENRIRQARKARGLSAQQLADMLEVHPSTLNNWESGRREILANNLITLADMLGFSVDYLLGRDVLAFSQTEPINKEALKTLHGQPVWTQSHGWMLVNIVESAFVACDLSLMPLDDIQDDIYIIPPALSNSLRGIGRPIDLNMIAKCERVWVEPITTDVILGSELRGWYRMNNNGRLVENEYGNRFYLDAYGVKWLAFMDCIEY